MKFFKVLPNHPLLRSLTFSQREFIIESMNEDVREQERQAKGLKKVTEANDKSFAKKFYSNETVDLLEDGDNLDDIYKQSLKIKEREDAKNGISEDYDKVITERINQAYEDKMHNIKNAKAQVEENWQNLLKDSKKYYTDDE